MTPYLLNIVMHYATCAGDYTVPAPILEVSIERLVSLQLLECRADDGRLHQITERGRKYFEMVLATPLPVWADPRLIPHA